MIKINCELSNQPITKEVEVNLKFKLKVGGTDVDDIQDSVEEFIKDHLTDKIEFDVDEITTEIKV